MIEDILARIRVCLAPVMAEQGADLVDLSVKRVQRQILIRVLADLPGGGITIGQCSRINKQLSRAIEEEQCIPGDYSVEVCSPGIDWPLSTGQDFMRVRGRPVRVLLTAPVRDRQEISGTVTGVEGDVLQIEGDGDVWGIPLKQIRKANQMLAEGKGHG